MIAEIISCGTELLMGQIVDTNSATLSAELPKLGIDLYFRETVGDNKDRLASVIKKAFAAFILISFHKCLKFVLGIAYLCGIIYLCTRKIVHSA